MITSCIISDSQSLHVILLSLIGATLWAVLKQFHLEKSLTLQLFNYFSSQIVEAMLVALSLGLYPAQIFPTIMMALCGDWPVKLAIGISLSGQNTKFCSTSSSLPLRVNQQVGFFIFSSSTLLFDGLNDWSHVFMHIIA